MGFRDDDGGQSTSTVGVGKIEEREKNHSSELESWSRRLHQIVCGSSSVILHHSVIYSAATAGGFVKQLGPQQRGTTVL